MSIFDNPLVAVIAPINRFHDARQDVIAGNIANANTPGYSAFDLVLRERVEGSGGLRLATSDPRHMGGTPTGNDIGANVERSRRPARIDGNNVSLEEELVKMMQNRMRYEVGVDLLDRFTGLNAVARARR